MPASPTRVCPTCNQSRLIAEFRDPGDVTFGRPPKHCRYCRAESPTLQDRQLRNKRRRGFAVARQRSYFRREPIVRFTSSISTHPDGTKRCPPLSGCGRVLPLWAYGFDAYQADGLRTRCVSCLAGAQETGPVIIPAWVPDRMPTPLRQLAELSIVYAAR